MPAELYGIKAWTIAPSSVRTERPYLVAGHGKARDWAETASPMDREDLPLAISAGLVERLHRAGYATPSGELLDDGWIVVVCTDAPPIRVWWHTRQRLRASYSLATGQRPRKMVKFDPPMDNA